MSHGVRRGGRAASLSASKHPPHRRPKNRPINVEVSRRGMLARALGSGSCFHDVMSSQITTPLHRRSKYLDFTKSWVMFRRHQGSCSSKTGKNARHSKLVPWYTPQTIIPLHHCINVVATRFPVFTRPCEDVSRMVLHGAGGISKTKASRRPYRAEKRPKSNPKPPEVRKS